MTRKRAVSGTNRNMKFSMATRRVVVHRSEIPKFQLPGNPTWLVYTLATKFGRPIYYMRRYARSIPLLQYVLSRHLIHEVGGRAYHCDIFQRFDRYRAYQNDAWTLVNSTPVGPILLMQLLTAPQEAVPIFCIHYHTAVRFGERRVQGTSRNA